MRTFISTTLVLVSLVSMLAGCQTHRNAHGLQNLEHAIRIETQPVGATLNLVKQGMVLTTPTDINLKIDPEDRIVISRPGFRTFRGTLNDMQKTALGTYRVDLELLD